MEVIERPKIREPVKFPATVRCPNHNCQCVIAYEDCDLFVGDDLMSMGFECPDCGEWITVKKLDKFAKYPEAFYSFKNGATQSDSQIQKWVDECIKCLKSTIEVGECCHIGSGDTMIIGRKGTEEDGNTIIVAKGYEQLTYFPQQGIKK